MKKVLIILLFFLTACTSVTVIKPGYKPLEPEQVTMILDSIKQYNIVCKKYEHIGYIVTAWKWSGEAAIQEAKEKTAQIGGNYFVGNLYSNDFNDMQITGNVYFCEK